jgi:hypothetical protein
MKAAEATANSVKGAVEEDPASSPPPRAPQYNTYETSPEPSGQVSSLRQRLAAATERAKMRSPEPPEDRLRPSSAVGNAAALRARLESVKRSSNM